MFDKIKNQFRNLFKDYQKIPSSCGGLEVFILLKIEIFMIVIANFVMLKSGAVLAIDVLKLWSASILLVQIEMLLIISHFAFPIINNIIVWIIKKVKK